MQLHKLLSGCIWLWPVRMSSLTMLMMFSFVLCWIFVFVCMQSADPVRNDSWSPATDIFFCKWKYFAGSILTPECPVSASSNRALSGPLYDNGCPGPGCLQARLAEMANIYTQIQFPAKLDSRMCSRHEYPRLEMRLFKFPLAPSLSAGMETQGLKTLVRLWGLENDPRLFREFIVRLILVFHLWCSVLTGPNILTSAPL